MINARIPFCIVFVLIATINHANAEMMTWDNDLLDNDWYSPENWSDDLFPGDNDQRIVSQGSPETFLNVNVSNGGLIEVENDGVTVTVNELRVGDSGIGLLDIHDGGQVSSAGSYVGDDAGSAGDVNIDGINSSWSSSQRLRVGYHGQGTVDITNGGQVSSMGGTIGRHTDGVGEVNVNGPDSLWESSQTIYIGNNGNGTLNITNGGSVSSWDAYIGRYAGSHGTALVGVADSLWTVYGEMYVGGSEIESGGTGEMTVGHGGEVHTTEALKIWDTGTVNLNGGTLHVHSLDDASGGTFNFTAGDLIIDGGTATIPFVGSEHGLAHLQFVNGATMNIPSLGIGDFGMMGEEVNGKVSVDGSGTTINADQIKVGFYSEGQLDVASGASIVCGSLIVGDYGGYGALNVDGVDTTITITGFLGVGFDDGDGHLLISNGGYVSSGSFSSEGTVTVDGLGSTWVNGNMSLGVDGIARLHIRNGGTVVTSYASLGDFGVGEGWVTVDGSGSSWTNHGNVDVGYDHYLGDIKVINGGELTVGGTLEVWSTGSVTLDGGSIHTHSLDLSDGGTLNFNYGQLTVDGGAWMQDANDDLVIAGADSGDLPTLKFINGATTYLNEWITIGDGVATNGALEILSGANPAADKVRIGYMDQSNGTVIVDGNGSILTTRGLAVGWGGDASLAITNGGQVAVNPVLGWGGVGYESTSNATVDISGAGSQLTSWDFRIGVGGNGEMDIGNQGSAEFTNLYIGGGPQDHHYGTGRLTVDGSGSSVLVSESMMIGYDGIGEMHITNGAVVNSMTSHIAYLTGSKGVVTVSGLGAVWENTARMNVGGDGLAAGGIGSLTVAASGLVEVGGVLKVWSTGTLNIDGGTVYTRSLDLSDAGDFNFNYGNLAIDGGALTADSLNVTGIGDQVSEQAYMEVKNGATVNLSGGLTVGSYPGDGELSITGGSKVFNDSAIIGNDGSGDVTVDGRGSVWDNSGLLTIGYGVDGWGGLGITNGGLVRSAGAIIGDEDYGIGGVLVDGPNSRWENTGYISIGDDEGGYGGLTIKNGAIVSNTGGLSLSQESEVTVSSGGELTSSGAVVGSWDSYSSIIEIEGAGSSWHNSGYLVVGKAGSEYVVKGTLVIRDGGVVTNGDAVIGDNEWVNSYTNCGYNCSDGRVTVDGADSTWITNGTLTLGYGPNGVDIDYGFAYGRLEVTNGAAVSSITAFLAEDIYAHADAIIDGVDSIWTNTGSMYVGGNQTTSGGNGELTISNGGEIMVGGTLKIWDTGQLSGDGLVTGNVDSDGAVKPGNSAGTLMIDGDYRQRADGVLVVELADSEDGQYDQLEITGQADLEGTLQIVFLDDFMPMPGEQFEILIANLVQGYFDQIIDNQETYPGLYFQQTATETGVIIKANALPGDANLDGQVGLLDLDILGRNWGKTGRWTEGDFSGGGEISLIDLDILGRHWGESLQAIPEPSVLAVLGCGVLLMNLRRQSA